METLIHADIFFFITSIAVVILTILLIIAFVYFIQILRNFRDISNTVRDGVDHASSHIEGMIDSFENNIIFRFLFGKKSKTRESSQESTKLKKHKK